VLATDPAANPTQLPEWADCLCRSRTYTDASRLYRLPDGRRLVLPMVARVVAGLRVAEESWPDGWGYGGLLVEGGGPLTVDDCRTVLADLAGRTALRRAVLPAPLLGRTWAEAAPPHAVRVPRLAYVLDLDGGIEHVRSTRFHRQTRKRLRKAERSELDITRETGADGAGRGLAMFGTLYREAIDRWAGQKGQPLPLARLLAAYRDRPGQAAAVADALGEHCVIYSATRRGEPVAAKVVLHHGGTTFAWMSARNAALSRETLANYLLQSVAVEEACAAGARWYNLGDTDPKSGVEEFKIIFGAQPVHYEAVRFERLPITGAERRLRDLLGAVSRRNPWRNRPGTPASSPAAAPDAPASTSAAPASTPAGPASSATAGS
jgi:hypothetical protein